MALSVGISAVLLGVAGLNPDAASRAQPAAEATSTPAPEAVAPAPQPGSPPPAPRSRADRLRADPELHARYRSARTLAIAGGATGAAGLFLILNGLVLVAVEATTRPPPELGGDGIRPARRVGWVLTAMGAVAFVPGVAIMAVGLHRRSQVLEELDHPRTLSARPWFGRGSGGLSLTLRY